MTDVCVRVCVCVALEANVCWVLEVTLRGMVAGPKGPRGPFKGPGGP